MMTSDSSKDRVVSISFTLMPQIIIKLIDYNKCFSYIRHPWNKGNTWGELHNYFGFPCGYFPNHIIGNSV